MDVTVRDGIQENVHSDYQSFVFPPQLSGKPRRSREVPHWCHLQTLWAIMTSPQKSSRRRFSTPAWQRWTRVITAECLNGLEQVSQELTVCQKKKKNPKNSSMSVLKLCSYVIQDSHISSETQLKLAKTFLDMWPMSWLFDTDFWSH